MKSIRFEVDGSLVEARPNESVLEACLRKKVLLENSCGGSGTCGTCRVFVEEGTELLPPRNELEAEMAEDRRFAGNERLACQMTPISGLKLRRPSKPS